VCVGSGMREAQRGIVFFVAGYYLDLTVSRGCAIEMIKMQCLGPQFGSAAGVLSARKRTGTGWVQMIPETAICLTSHDRLDCASINQEIFRLNFVQPYTIVHASSGPDARPYLEDVFVHSAPQPHFVGALALMKCAISAARKLEPDFLVLLEADTWLLDEHLLQGFIRRMQADSSLLIAACAWKTPPRALTRRLAREVIELARAPGERLRRMATLLRRLRYDAVDFGTQFWIMRNQAFLVDLFCGMQPDNRRMVERQWFERFSTYFGFEQVLRMREREPVHPHQRFACDRLALHSEHWPAVGTCSGNPDPCALAQVAPGAPGKREALMRYPHIRTGECIQRLLCAKTSAELAYYNKGAHRY